MRLSANGLTGFDPAFLGSLVVAAVDWRTTWRMTLPTRTRVSNTSRRARGPYVGDVRRPSDLCRWFDR